MCAVCRSASAPRTGRRKECDELVRPPRPSSARPRYATGEGPGTPPLPAASAPRTALARAVVGRALERLPLTVRPAGEPEFGLGGPELRLHRPDDLYRRIGAEGLIGFGESYLARDWDAPDLPAVLAVLADHATTLVPPSLQRLRGLWAPRHPSQSRNTPTAARANISHHYDLSNDLFALFLDETLTYSSAVFPSLPASWPDLAAAQRHKIDLLLDLAEVGSGTRVLEIGTGWGELALRAARRGAHVTTLTLSTEQRSVARRRAASSGVSSLVDVQLCDYREATGRYDAVLSVEMIEAVGEEFWPRYFTVVDQRLAPGGRAALQTITMPHDRLRATRRTHTWIQKYIFPGGLIPSVRAVRDITERHTALRLSHRDRYGPHYAETLRLWRERFTGHREQVHTLGFDDSFSRMWTFYLAYCEAGFRSGYLDVQQLLLTKSGARR
ncbi:class I SAM-dependent methyltransferase [Streptomyces sp. NA04227]|nr:class I SAM-dependent methyltransferase [Streptomyces sp. NA04227]